MPAQPLLAVTDDQTFLPAMGCPCRRSRAPQIRNGQRTWNETTALEPMKAELQDRIPAELRALILARSLIRSRQTVATLTRCWFPLLERSGSVGCFPGWCSTGSAMA
jgi:hypothetical protein